MTIRDVPTELWAAIAEQARMWRTSTVVNRFNADLPWNAPPEACAWGSGTVSALLQSLTTSTGSLMHPLRLGSVVPLLREEPSLGRELVEERDLNDWLVAAKSVETSHFISLCWFRSRLAGYPILRAPQLAVGTTYTSTDLGIARFAWTRDERRAGLQRTDSPPPNCAQQIGLGADEIGVTARAVARALQHSAAWQEFDEANHRLNEDSKADLRGATQELKHLMSTKMIDQHEPGRMVGRDDYRRHHTAEVIDSLTGVARDYADAFTAVDSLLRFVTCDVFGQLLTRQPIRALDVQNPVFPDADSVEFVMKDESHLRHPETGEVVWINDDTVPGAVLLEEVSFHWDLVERATWACRARILHDTERAWSRPSSPA